MSRMYRFIVLMAALVFGVTAGAQNLDPTVEVSRAYEGTLIEAHKPVMEISVPDSVNNFRLDFDYSVFESPYKGSYEFNPYMASMRPEATPYDPQVFYLRAGAGYRLHPVADLIWSPDFKKGFRLDIYAIHRSYVGDYRNISVAERGQKFYLDGAPKGWKGYDFHTNAGVSGRYEWESGTFDFDASYLGIQAKDTLKKRSFNGLDLSVGVASKKAKTFVYDVSMDYRFADDKNDDSMKGLQEHLFSFDADLGPKFKIDHKILFNFGADMALYSKTKDWGTANIHFTPHYVFEKGRWQIDAGVRLDFLVSSNDTGNLRANKRQQLVYPDVHVEFSVIKNAMNLYAEAKGGTRLNTYSGMVLRNHFADTDFLHGNIFDADVERVRTVLGLKGRIGSRFSYDLRGGYVGYANGILDALYLGNGMQMMPRIGYATYQSAFAQFNWLLDTERFRFDGTVSYAGYWGFQDAQWLFEPASFTGDVAMEGNIRKRIFFGADCSFATKRSLIVDPGLFRDVLYIPMYADLGVYVEVATSRKLSFWARGGNLLNMTIQRTPLYAEGGINFTAGICLNL